MAKMKLCKACGKEVASSAKVCPGCGQKLKMGFGMKLLIGVGGLIVLGVIISANGGDNGASTSSVNAPSTTTSKPADKKQEDPQIEGDASNVHIKVLGMETKDSVGNQYITKKAQGTFKIIKLSVKNNQKDAITVDSNSFKLLDSEKREFSQSSEGGTTFSVANNSAQVFIINTVNPGNTLEGYVVFDVPKEAKGFVLQAKGGFTGDTILLKVE
jgi:hypothetical protein